MVAQEVKTLAGQTAKATDEISNQIASMQLATEKSVVAIKAISQTIERSSGIAGSIPAAVEQQKSATHNIVASVRAAVSGTADVAVNVRQAAEGANETGETSIQPDVCFRRPRPRRVRALTSSFRVGADASPGTTFGLFRLRHDPDVGLRFLPALRVDRLGLVVGD